MSVNNYFEDDSPKSSSLVQEEISLKSIFNEIIEDYFKFPLYILTHPIAGFDQLKRENKGKVSVAIVFMLLLGLLNILTYQYSGFLVNFNNPRELNSIREISFVVVAILLFSIGNWSITTLFDGKGKFKEIFMMTCYSTFPMLLLGFPNLILSLIYTNEEVSFYYILSGIAVFLMILLIFVGLLVIHEYSVARTLLTIIFTGVAMAVILFIALLFFNIAQQVVALVTGLYREITWRYF